MEQVASAIEPELRGATPRRVSYTAGTQAARTLCVVLLVGVTWLVGWLGARDIGDLNALLGHGMTTTAHVTDKHEHHGKSTSYSLDYSFTVDGEEVDSNESISHYTYDYTNIGDPIDVTYLPEQPQTHRVGAVTRDRVDIQRTEWQWGDFAAAGIMGLILLAVELNYRGHRRLLETGVPVRGEVTDRSMVRGKSTTYYLYYEFPGPLQTQTNKITVSRFVFDSNPPGEDLTVLYDPAKPTYNRPYCTLTDVQFI